MENFVLFPKKTYCLGKLAPDLFVFRSLCNKHSSSLNSNRHNFCVAPTWPDEKEMWLDSLVGGLRSRGDPTGDENGEPADNVGYSRRCSGTSSCAGLALGPPVAARRPSLSCSFRSHMLRDSCQ